MALIALNEQQSAKNNEKAESFYFSHHFQPKKLLLLKWKIEFLKRQTGTIWQSIYSPNYDCMLS